MTPPREPPTLCDAGVDGLPEVMTTMADAFDPVFGEAWTQSQCLGILSLPGVWLTLARIDDRPAGFALSRVVIDEAELLLLAVRPADRRAGIGLALLEHVAHAARTRGARRLFLEVRSGNPARGLYDAAGFRAVGTRQGYYRGRDGTAHDAHTLERRLDIR
ncbi:GNAT family N-acetyltransferase [Sphingomonas montana]|uniref:GNAT family N-acetyltransferase n=1 Tax=Sphingomonas montana TaxID=1843236 RepID=UPI00096DDDB5|nr:GNAT family N-acetyltransferase [Sphingomonas montana]